MRLACISQDKVLIEKFKTCSFFTTVFSIDDSALFQTKWNTFDALVFSDRIVSLDKLPYLREKSAHAIMFYMISNSPDYKFYQKIETMCHAHDIQIIYPKQTQEQIVDFVANALKPIDNLPQNHVAAFVGSQSKVGVTTVVMSVASRLGVLAEAKIGVLGLNSWNPGTCYIREYGGAYLDELKTLLSNKMLSTSQLMQEMHKFNNFFYLAGNRDIKKRLHYSIKEIHYLIEQSKKVYDLILIDAGCNYDDALCIQSLINSDTKFLITNQLLSGLESWNRAYEQVLEPTGFSKREFLMLVNQYRNKPHLPDIKQLAHDYGIPYMKHIADVGELGLVVEVNQNMILDYDEPDYLKDIDFIAKALVKTYRLPAKELQIMKKAGLIRRLLG